MVITLTCCINRSKTNNPYVCIVVLVSDMGVCVFHLYGNCSYVLNANMIPYLGKGY